MMKTAILIAALAAPMLAVAAAPADYATVFPIQTPGAASAPSSAWRIELTPAVYAWLQDGALGDIEVFNAAQQPVPIARVATAPQATSAEQIATLPVLALPAQATTATSANLRLVIDRDADGRLRRIDAADPAPAASAAVRDWVLDASAFAHPLDRITLDWTAPTAGVVAHFRIEASEDLQSWRSVGSGTVIALEQDGARLERRDLPLGGVRAAYLRLHRTDDGPALEGLGVHARAIELGVATQPRQWVGATLDSAASASASKTGTRFVYALPAALPIDAARIQLGDDNALAQLDLGTTASADANAPLRALAHFTAFRLRQGDELLQNADLEFGAGSRARWLRIDTPTPLASAPTLQVGYRPESIVFLAEGAGPYTLGVGSLRARHAAYPVDAALATLRAKFGKDWQPPVATLGAAVASGGSAAITPPAAPLPWRQWLLWIVLVGAAALVGGFALHLLRNPPRDPPR